MTRYRRSSPTDDAIDAQRATSHDEQSRLRQQALEAVNEGLSALHVAEESRQQCPRHDDALNLIGALVDLGDLCVAHHPFDREVDVLAGAPNSCTALVVTSIATSEAKHFAAAEMKLSPGSPRWARAAAVYTINRAASTFIAMSASMNCTPWKSLTGLRNCLRSVVYAIAASKAPCAMPTACAPIVGRVWSRLASAVLNPLPGSPMMRSPGMRQFSKYSSVVGEPLMPSLRSLGPTVKPSSSLWTTNAEMPLAPLSGSVRHHGVPG